MFLAFAGAGARLDAVGAKLDGVVSKLDGVVSDGARTPASSTARAGVRERRKKKTMTIETRRARAAMGMNQTRPVSPVVEGRSRIQVPYLLTR